VSVVVRAADGGPVSLVVDQIGDVIEADEAALEPPPDTVPHELRELVLGICKLDEQLMLLLDTERAVAVADAAA
jgi:purine-binding chemotaxis protein CheW